MRLLATVVFLTFTYGQAQSQCPMITEEILLSTDRPTRSNLLVQTYDPNANPTTTIIQLQEFNIVCLAAASKRDMYRFASVVVKQVCSGNLCPIEQRGVSALVQYDFECSSTINQWTPMTFGGRDVREDNPTADLETELRTNCSACSKEFSGGDPVTHCLRKYNK